MWTVLWFLIYTICACMHTPLYIIYVYSQKICIYMYCFPARTSGSYICSYCIICKAPLFSDLKDMAGPSSVHCDGAQSADGCKMHPCPIKSRLLLLYITEPQIAFLYHNTGLNLSMNNRATTFLTCFGASARIICSVSKTPSFLPSTVQLYMNTTVRISRMVSEICMHAYSCCNNITHCICIWKYERQ